MSFLAVAPIHGRLELENRSYLYEQLTRIVGRVLARALEPQALERSEAGEWYAKFATYLVERRAIIITFNYDLPLLNLGSAAVNHVIVSA